MKKTAQLLITAFLLIGIQLGSSGQLLYNNGNEINLRNGINVFVGGNVQNENGTIDVDAVSGNSELFVQDDFINNDVAGGDGYYRIVGNWTNNATFNAGTGTVFLEGNDQTIGGIVSTTFNNLTLDGSGVKTQAIDQYCTGILNLNDIELNTDIYGIYLENTDVNAITLGTGFVSSLDGGFLSRATNAASAYLFPVGSSAGTMRYRPVELTPDGTGNTFTVRMANTDATSEGFDLSAFETGVCEVNPLFYHQIDRTAGTSTVDLSIYYDDATDGSWEGIVNWSAGPGMWEIIPGSTTVSGTPLYEASTTGWNSFSDLPYALFISAPEADAGADFEVCEGENINLTESGGDADSWEWSGPDGFSSTAQDPAISGATASADGLYSVTVTDGNGCTAEDDVTVQVITVSPSITDPGSFCYNDDPVDLEATPAGGTWSGTGITDAAAGTFDPSVADIGMNTITYEVTESGCTGQSSIDIQVYETADAGIDDPGDFCSDDDTLVLSAATPGGTWNGDAIDPSTGVFDPAVAGAGAHEIIYTISGDCGDADTVYVTVHPRANATIINPEDSMLVTDQSTFLDAVDDGGDWSGNGIDPITGEFTPQEAGIGDHQIIYTIDQLCGDIDSTIIVVSPEQIEDLLIPDVITPNDDGYNDTWGIQGIEAYDDISIFIFNRWGDEVFSFNGSGSSYTDIQNQWDGIWQGKDLPFGTYFYILELNESNTYKGSITIIR
jgi:gliding motility-associated-like protein